MSPAKGETTRPLPLVFAFHGRGRTHEDCRGTDCKGIREVIEPNAVVVYMKSFGAGWEQNEDRETNVEFFRIVLESTKREFCIDETRIIVAGTSSGARFTNILACRFGQQLFAAAPVAGSMPEQDCKRLPATIVIHGIDDPWVTLKSGEAARDFFALKNGCNAPRPPLSDVRSRVRRARNANQVLHACADYQGCATGTALRYCEHSEGGYDGSTHGWPTVGGALIWEFVTAL